MNGKLWGDDIINSLTWKFISNVQEMFLEDFSDCQSKEVIQYKIKFTANPSLFYKKKEKEL